MKRNRSHRTSITVRGALRLLVATLPLLVLLVPATWIERHPVPCLFTVVLKMRCPGCGMVRAVSCMVHGRPQDALRYNPLVVVVAPLVTIEWLRFMRGSTRAFIVAG